MMFEIFLSVTLIMWHNCVQHLQIVGTQAQIFSNAQLHRRMSRWQVVSTRVDTENDLAYVFDIFL